MAGIACFAVRAIDVTLTLRMRSQLSGVSSKTDPRLPYVEQPPGDHYEETNSLGVMAGTQVRALIEELLDYPPQ